MMRHVASAALTWLVVTSGAAADVVVLDAVQTGGFYPVGAPDNLPSFQNYFVGYGSLTGGGRTLERRSFFWFDLASVSGDITSATLTLKLPSAGGLIFGKADDPAFSDPSETFSVTATDKPSSMVTSTMLSPTDIGEVFTSFAAGPTIGSVTFPPAPPADELIHISLSPLGLTYLETRAGSDVVLTGWMSSWSHDPRTDGTGGWVEGSELMFGHTDVHLADFPSPTLTLVISPIPEAGGALMLTAVCTMLTGRLLRRNWP